MNKVKEVLTERKMSSKRIDRRTKYKWVHGLLKSSLTNGINLAYAALPKEVLIQSKEDVVNTPEVYNVLEAYDRAIQEYNTNNCTQEFKDTDSFKKMQKMKDLAVTMLASDSAYYTMFEYFLRHYCEIKFGKDCLDKFDAQGDEVFQKLTSKNPIK